MKASPSPPSLELKLEYQQEAKQFTLHLIEKFGDQDGTFYIAIRLTI